MKSMLSDLSVAPKDRDFSWDGELVYTTEYGDNLRTALVAALAVIADINLFVDDEVFVIIRQLPEFKALETALEPFKVAGDDAKDGF